MLERSKLFISLNTLRSSEKRLFSEMTISGISLDEFNPEEHKSEAYKQIAVCKKELNRLAGKSWL